MLNPVACVSGGSSGVGSRIVRELLLRGYRVRVLSRKTYFAISGVEIFNGDINDDTVLKKFMQDCQMVFHCAAELENTSMMWAVNVTGTERMLKYAEYYYVKYFCYLSSVGVTGKTNLKWVDELTPCDPQNDYEKSKWAAEQLVERGIKGCKVVILRPTNVVDEKKPGILALPKRGSFIDLCKVFIKGSENAHIVHADDVAAAALHFISYPLKTPQCYIISYDHEPLNTFGGIWMLYKALQDKKELDNLCFFPHLPMLVPYILRKILRGRSNMGDVRYSSKKLIKTGFTFKLGLKETVNQIASVFEAQASSKNKRSCFDKPVVLTFIGSYLPGYKAGGILRVLVNTVDHLCDEFEFRIVTRDRDVGDGKPYPGIEPGCWQQVGNAAVIYLSPESVTVKYLLNLIESTPHHVLFLNSFFDPLTIKVLLIRKLSGGAPFKPVIVAPWGEFAWASLKQKYLKKFFFIHAARFFGLYYDVIWRASSKFEQSDIMKIMKMKADAIHITGDFPFKNIPDSVSDKVLRPLSDDKNLRIVFLSRISREKNLDYALKILSKVKVDVVFDIYGPAENAAYWKECQELIHKLPTHVRVNYLG
ncbi:MAG: NAD-dependent epimerase/dehydratase family protein, partial [bacterium]